MVVIIRNLLMIARQQPTACYMFFYITPVVRSFSYSFLEVDNAPAFFEIFPLFRTRSDPVPTSAGLKKVIF